MPNFSWEKCKQSKKQIKWRTTNKAWDISPIKSQVAICLTKRLSSARWVRGRMLHQILRAHSSKFYFYNYLFSSLCIFYQEQIWLEEWGQGSKSYRRRPYECTDGPWRTNQRTLRIQEVCPSVIRSNPHAQGWNNEDKEVCCITDGHHIIPSKEWRKAA